MVRGRAGRRDRIVDAFDLEPRGKRRRCGGRHRLGHGEGSDALGALVAGDVGGLDDGARRRPTRPHDNAGHLMGDFVLLEPGIADRLLHGDMVPGRAAAEEAHRATIDRLLRIESGRSVHLTAKAEFGILIGARNSRFGFTQARQHFLGIVADRRDDTHPGDDDSSHECLVRIATRAVNPAAAVSLRSAASLHRGTGRLSGPSPDK